MKKIQSIIEKLFGSSEKFELEKRILNASLLNAAIVATIILVENLIFGLPLLNILIIICSVVFYFSIYVYSRLHPKSEFIRWLYLIFSNLLIMSIWIFLHSYNGISLPFWIGILATVALTLRKNQVLYGYCIMAFSFSIMFLVTMLFPDLIVVAPRSLLRYLIYLVDVGVVGLGLAVTTYLSMNSFRIEKQKSHNRGLEIETVNKHLLNKNKELEIALSEIKALQGILPICSHCKKIRNDQGYWNQLETYFNEHSDIQFSHGICPDCMKKEYPHIYEQMKKNGEI